MRRCVCGRKRSRRCCFPRRNRCSATLYASGSEVAGRSIDRSVGDATATAMPRCDERTTEESLVAASAERQRSYVVWFPEADRSRVATRTRGVPLCHWSSQSAVFLASSATRPGVQRVGQRVVESPTVRTAIAEVLSVASPRRN